MHATTTAHLPLLRFITVCFTNSTYAGGLLPSLAKPLAKAERACSVAYAAAARPSARKAAHGVCYNWPREAVIARG